MKILLLIDSLGLGGAQRQIINLAGCLKNDGHEIVFCIYSDDMFYLPLLKENQIEPVLIKNSGIFSRIKSVRRYVRKHSPDVVISFMFTPNFLACVSSIGKHSWKLILSDRIANEKHYKSLRYRFMMWFDRYADYIVCNSYSAMRMREKNYPHLKEKLRTIYNIIEVPEQITNNENDKTVVLVAARYEQEKNLDGLIQAVSILPKEIQEKLEIQWYGKLSTEAGENAYLDAAEKAIKDKGLHSIIILNDIEKRIYEKISSADYVALFSHIEGLPNTILEGMQLGKPIISSCVSDYKVLVDHTNGFLCDSKDANSIASAIKSAVLLPETERKKMGNASKQKVESICSKAIVMSQWKELLVNE